MQFVLVSSLYLFFIIILAYYNNYIKRRYQHNAVYSVKNISRIIILLQLLYYAHNTQELEYVAVLLLMSLDLRLVRVVIFTVEKPCAMLQHPSISHYSLDEYAVPFSAGQVWGIYFYYSIRISTNELANTWSSEKITILFIKMQCLLPESYRSAILC